MNTKCVCCAAAGAAGRMSYTVFLHSNVLFLRSNVVSLRSSVSSLLTSVLSLQRSVLQRKMLRRQKLLSTIEQCVLFLRGDKTRMAGDQGESCTVSVHVRCGAHMVSVTKTKTSNSSTMHNDKWTRCQ